MSLSIKEGLIIGAGPTEVWPNVRNLSSRGIPNSLFEADLNGSTTGEVNRIYYVPFILQKTIIASSIGLEVTTLDAGGDPVRAGIYDVNSSGEPENLLAQTSDIDVTTTGFKSTSLLSSVSLNTGIYYSALATTNATAAFKRATETSMSFAGLVSGGSEGVELFRETLGVWSVLPDTAGTLTEVAARNWMISFIE